MDFLQYPEGQILGVAIAVVAVGASAYFLFSSKKPKGLDPCIQLIFFLWTVFFGVLICLLNWVSVHLLRFWIIDIDICCWIYNCSHVGAFDFVNENKKMIFLNILYSIVCLDPENFKEFKLVKRTQLSHNVAKFRFELPTPTSVLGLPIGQHISCRSIIYTVWTLRYISIFS